MTTTVAAPEHPLMQRPRRSRARRLLLGPNLLRAIWMAAVGAAFAFGLVVALRAIQGFPIFEGSPIVVEDQASFDKWATQAKKNQNTVGGIS